MPHRDRRYLLRTDPSAPFYSQTLENNMDALADAAAGLRQMKISDDPIAFRALSLVADDIYFGCVGVTEKRSLEQTRRAVSLFEYTVDEIATLDSLHIAHAQLASQLTGYLGKLRPSMLLAEEKARDAQTDVTQTTTRHQDRARPAKPTFGIVGSDDWSRT